jgi:hypothetical protein
VAVEVTRRYEGLIAPFPVSRDVSIAPGAYSFDDAQVRYVLGQQRRVSGTIAVQRGGFYDGTITGVSVTAARASITTRWSIEPSVSINRVDLPAGAFTTQVLRARTDFGFTPRMFVSGLLQYGSAERLFSTNLRFRWEYLPGSELFVVYTDERDTTLGGYPALRNRAFVVKVNRLVRF